MISRMGSLILSRSLCIGDHFASSRIRSIILLARLPLLTIRSTACLASCRVGGLWASQRQHAFPLVTIAANGWLTSWAIEAVNSPNVVTRAMCAICARAACIAVSADLILNTRYVVAPIATRPSPSLMIAAAPGGPVKVRKKLNIVSAVHPADKMMMPTASAAVTTGRMGELGAAQRYGWRFVKVTLRIQVRFHFHCAENF